eukprot:g20313.t1
MDRNPRVSSSRRRRNVVKPGRIDTLLGHEREGLHLNFGVAMQMHRRSYESASGRPVAGGAGVGSGSSGQGGRSRAADSSDALTPSGRLGAYSHGVFPSQTPPLSQSLSDTGGFGLSQPSPDLLAPYPNAHQAQEGGGAAARGRSAPMRVSGVHRRAGENRGAEASLQSSGSCSSSSRRRMNEASGGRLLQHSRLFSSTASSTGRRQQDGGRGETNQGLRHRHGRVSKAGVGVGEPQSTAGMSGKGVGSGTETSTAALQAFERLLSEQFRSQVMSELSDLRMLLETTCNAAADQAKGNAKILAETREFANEAQESHNAARAAKDSTGKALGILKTAVPDAFLSLENRLEQVEAVVTGVAETAAATLAACKEAAAAAASAAAAATAAAASMSELVTLRRARSGSVEGRVQGVRLWPQQQQQQQQEEEEERQQQQQQQQQQWNEPPSTSQQRESNVQPTIHRPGAEEESFRWTQPSGEVSIAAATTTSPAAAPQPTQQAPHSHVPVKVTAPNGTEQHCGGSRSPVAPSSPMLSVPAAEDRAEWETETRGWVDLAIATPSTLLLPPGQDMDSFNPFQEDGLAPISGKSADPVDEANTKAAVTATLDDRGSSPPTRTGLEVRPADPTADGAAASGARGSGPTAAVASPVPSKGSGPGAQARRKRLRSPSPPKFLKPPPGAAAGAKPGSPCARLSRSRSSARVVTRRSMAGHGLGRVAAGITEEVCSSDDGRATRRRDDCRPTRTIQPHQLSDPPSRLRSSTISVRAFSRGSSAGRGGGTAMASAAELRSKQSSAPKMNGGRRRSASRDAPSSRASLPAECTRSTATPSFHEGASVGRVGAAPVDDSGTMTHGDRSVSDKPIDGVTQRATPLRASAAGAITASVPSRNIEGEGDEDEEDSVGGPGLTVEAYMAKKRHAMTWVTTGSCPYFSRCVFIHDPRIRGPTDAYLYQTKIKKGHDDTGKGRSPLGRDIFYWPDMLRTDAHGNAPPDISVNYDLDPGMLDSEDPIERAMYHLWYSLVGTVLEIAEETKTTCEQGDLTQIDTRDTFFKATSSGPRHTRKYPWKDREVTDRLVGISPTAPHPRTLGARNYDVHVPKTPLPLNVEGTGSSAWMPAECSMKRPTSKEPAWRQGAMVGEENRRPPAAVSSSRGGGVSSSVLGQRTPPLASSRVAMSSRFVGPNVIGELSHGFGATMRFENDREYMRSSFAYGDTRRFFPARPAPVTREAR